MKPVRLPPYADFLGIHIIGEAEGQPLLAMPFAEGLTGWPDRLHGGAVAGLLELAGISAVLAALDAPAPPTIKPVTVTIDFIRPARPVETRAVGHVARLGRRIVNVEMAAWQDDPDQPVASARMNVMLEAG